MKLVIQIPCFNEEQTLPETLRDIPREIPGVGRVELLIVDDGSGDRTVEIARELGVEHIVRHKHNQGLARAFRSGIEHALAVGADIIVNTDGDNQYRGADIPRLIAPILAGQADIVVGDRQTGRVAHFSPLKKLLQRLGSHVVRGLSRTAVPDAVSGFRAISRDAAIELNIVSSFSYTIEMLIQAGRKGLRVASVPIGTNAKTRESRLFKSLPGFLGRSAATMLRIYAMYRPLHAFLYIGLALMGLGSLPVFRFLWFYLTESGDGHLQSLILGGVLLVMGLITLLFGLIADLIGFNRQLIEMTLSRVRRLELALDTAPSLRSGLPVREQMEALRDGFTAWPTPPAFLAPDPEPEDSEPEEEECVAAEEAGRLG